MIISFFLVITSCQDIPSVSPPDRLVDKRQMEDIMYESVLINSAKGYNMAKLKLVGIKPETHIYDKFDIDSTVFAQNLEYYTADVDEFKAMNARVLNKIKQQFTIADSLEKTERKIQDSLRTKRSKEIIEENKALDSLEKNTSTMPTRTMTDSFARKYRGIKNVTDSI